MKYHDRIQGDMIMEKVKVAFVCIHNSCRSQMAEGWAKHLGSDVIEAYSAGTEDYPEVKPDAVKVMEQAGVSMKDHHPKLLEAIPPVDVVITMGCGVECPYLPSRHREDWGLEDPSGKPFEEFIKTRELIKEKVLDLIKRIEENTLFEN